MILNDLFESKMSDLDIQYQDYKKLNPGAFHSRYKMTPDEWASRHWSLIKSSQTVHEGATVAYVVSYFDTKTGDHGESTVSALTQDDARDQIVDLMHERGYDVVVTGVRSAQGVAEADETSWTANSAQFRKEEDMSWTVEVTLEPRADINQGRGRRVKTQTVTAQSKDAAKKKLADYYRKNGWEVVGIKFAGDLAEGEDKVRQVNDAEYYHLKLLAKEAGITLTGMGADKVTGDLHWQGDTRDGRRVSGTVKKVIDDNGEYIQGAAEKQLDEKQDACYHKVKSRYKVWPSAYASGALVQCRKKGAANWGNKSKK